MTEGRATTPGLALRLSRTAPGLLALGCCALGGLLAGRLPLLEVPGWELGTAAGLLLSPLGAALGVAGVRRRAAPVRAFAAAALVLLAALALLLTGAWTRAALSTPCRPGAGAALLGLAALPSALLGAALGVLCGALARGRALPAAALCAAAFAGSLGSSLARAWLGPGAAVLDHLLGFWPGPIYDEALAADARLLLFRAGSLAWTAALVAAAEAWARGRAGRPGLAAVALGAALCAALGLRALGGVEPGRDEVARALGGLREGPRCLVHHPSEWTPAAAERLLRDCEASAAGVARALELPRPPRARVFVYRSPEEKRRLVAAGRTSFTKPWLAEIHVNDEPSPRPVLRHELVHALASSAARGPLGVPARALVRVNAGLVEGLASALEPPRGEHTHHEWARAMRDLGLLPAPADLLGDRGFLAAAPARAYAAAGSFVAFLLERHGPGPVKALYGGASPREALGQDGPALAAAWAAFLDGVAVPEELRAAAEQRFREGSLFARACAREQASLLEEARAGARRGRAAEAERDYRRASLLAGGDPAPLREAADAWAPRDAERAQALYAEALERAGDGQRALRAGLLLGEGDLALARGDRAAAAGKYRAALPLAGDPAEQRALAARLAVAADEALTRTAAPWLLGLGDPGVALARLAESPHPLSRYLLARAALGRGAPRLARASLRGLDPAALPGPRFALEARRLDAEAACAAGDFGSGIAGYEAIAASAPREAERERARDGAFRCRFERDAYGRGVGAPGDE